MWRRSSASLAVFFLVAGVVAAMPAPGPSEGAIDDYPGSLSALFDGETDAVDADADGDAMWRERRDPHAPSKGSLQPTDGKWTLGLGVLGNMQQFFDNLKTNLDGLEALPKEERDAVLGKALLMAEPLYWTPLRSPTTQRGICGGKPCWQSFSRYSRFPHVFRLTRSHDAKNTLTAPEQDRSFRPRSTAAYLHALRNHRPSHKLRNFVEDSEIANLRGANNYDPNLLWSGLGKRR